MQGTKASTPLQLTRPDDVGSDSDNLFAFSDSNSIRGDQCTGDDMDTQAPPPLYMNPEGLKKLELVSEDSEEDQDTFSPVPSIPFSLGVGRGKINDVVVECSPDVSNHPSPDIFKDIKFVLSCEAQKNSDTHYAGLRKDSYAKLITEGGGMVYDAIPSDLKNSLLISERSSHSSTFLKALLLGIPCIKNTWIDHVLKYGHTHGECRIPNIEWCMYLPRGQDLITKKYINQSKKHPGNPPKPFTDQIVYLQGSNDFKDTWEMLIVNGGGNAIKRWFRSCVHNDSTFPTIVVSEGQRKLSTTTLNFKVEIVSPSWLIQCIILGESADTAPFLLDI